MARNISDMMPIFRDKSMDKSEDSNTTNFQMNEANKLLSKFDRLQSKNTFLKQSSSEVVHPKPMEQKVNAVVPTRSEVSQPQESKLVVNKTDSRDTFTDLSENVNSKVIEKQAIQK